MGYAELLGWYLNFNSNQRIVSPGAPDKQMVFGFVAFGWSPRVICGHVQAHSESRVTE